MRFRSLITETEITAWVGPEAEPTAAAEQERISTAEGVETREDSRSTANPAPSHKSRLYGVEVDTNAHTYG